MDVYRFINSKDIRKFLRDKNYKFTSLEASWLVNQCIDASLKEKHSAWNEIINTMPDCVITQRMNCDYRPSLHEFLKEYMDLQNRIVAEMMENEENTFYQLEFCKQKIGWFGSHNGSKATYKDAYSEAAEELKAGDTICIRIKKEWKGKEKIRSLEIKGNGEIYTVNAYGFSNETDKSIFETFNGLWFDFPIPFEKGDIIYNPQKTYGAMFISGPFVFKEKIMPHESSIWNIKDIPLRDTYDSKLFMTDSTDMAVSGYFQDGGGHLYSEIGSDIMDFEYYTGRLDGKKAILKALGNCLKGRIDAVSFARAYHSILMKVNADRSIPTDCSDEEMALMGLR